MESRASIRMSPRRRPLRTCAVSAVAIATKLYSELQNFGEPMASMTKKIMNLATCSSPIVHPLLRQLSAICSFMDAIFLSVVNIIETIFPPSKCLFQKMDAVLEMTETLPENLDFALKKMFAIVHKLPFLEQILVIVISLLNALLYVLHRRGSETAKEKEIVVDTNCNRCNIESAVLHESDMVFESSILKGTIMETNHFPELDRLGFEDTIDEIKEEKLKSEMETESESTFQEQKTMEPDQVFQSDLSTFERETETNEVELCVYENDVAHNTATEDVFGGVDPAAFKESGDEVTEIGNSFSVEGFAAPLQDGTASKKEERDGNEGSLLELFESAWLMSPGKRHK